MYIILYTKIGIQTNTRHIPITLPPPPTHRKHSNTPMYTNHIYTQKNEVRIPYPLLTTANEADSAYVCDSKMGYSICNWTSNIKHRMECQ